MHPRDSVRRKLNPHRPISDTSHQWAPSSERKKKSKITQSCAESMLQRFSRQEQIANRDTNPCAQWLQDKCRAAAVGVIVVMLSPITSSSLHFLLWFSSFRLVHWPRRFVIKFVDTFRVRVHEYDHRPGQQTEKNGNKIYYDAVNAHTAPPDKRDLRIIYWTVQYSIAKLAHQQDGAAIEASKKHENQREREMIPNRVWYSADGPMIAMGSLGAPFMCERMTHGRKNTTIDNKAALRTFAPSAHKHECDAIERSHTDTGDNRTMNDGDDYAKWDVNAINNIQTDIKWKREIPPHGNRRRVTHRLHFDNQNQKHRIEYCVSGVHRALSHPSRLNWIGFCIFTEINRFYFLLVPCLFIAIGSHSRRGLFRQNYRSERWHTDQTATMGYRCVCAHAMIGNFKYEYLCASFPFQPGKSASDQSQNHTIAIPSVFSLCTMCAIMPVSSTYHYGWVK